MLMFDELLFDNIPDSILVIDDNCRIVKYNQKAVDFFLNGFSKDFSNIDLSELEVLNSVRENVFQKENFKVYFEFDFENREATYRNKEGFLYNILFSSKSFRFNDQTFYILTFKNITDMFSYKHIFEELYNNLSSKTIELDNAIIEKDSAIKEKDHINQILNKKNIEQSRQMNLAKDIQRRLFPDLNINLKNFKIVSRSIAASIISGDMIILCKQTDQVYDFIIADVTGHGFPSALITMLFKMSFQNAYKNYPKPDEIVNKIYLDIKHILTNSTIFITMIYGRFDINNGDIAIYNFGNPPPILIKSSGEIEKFEVGGMMLGVIDELDYSKIDIKLQRGERLLFYTDGLTEARNNKMEFFEEELNKTIKENINLKAVDFVDKLVEATVKFSDNEELKDDLSILLINYE